MSKLIYNSKQNAKYNFFNVFRHNNLKKRPIQNECFRLTKMYGSNYFI